MQRRELLLVLWRPSRMWGLLHEPERIISSSSMKVSRPCVFQCSLHGQFWIVGSELLLSVKMILHTFIVVWCTEDPLYIWMGLFFPKKQRKFKPIKRWGIWYVQHRAIILNKCCGLLVQTISKDSLSVSVFGRENKLISLMEVSCTEG